MTSFSLEGAIIVIEAAALALVVYGIVGLLSDDDGADGDQV